MSRARCGRRSLLASVGRCVCIRPSSMAAAPGSRSIARATHTARHACSIKATYWRLRMPVAVSRAHLLAHAASLHSPRIAQTLRCSARRRAFHPHRVFDSLPSCLSCRRCGCVEPGRREAARDGARICSALAIKASCVAARQAGKRSLRAPGARSWRCRPCCRSAGASARSSSAAPRRHRPHTAAAANAATPALSLAGKKNTGARAAAAAAELAEQQRPCRASRPTRISRTASCRSPTSAGCL